MIKRTLYFGHPAHLSVSLAQLKVSFPEKEQKETQTIPLEDIGLVVFDHSQITFTQSVCTELLERNAAVVWCDSRHQPLGMAQNLIGSHTFTQSLKVQIEASEPLKKQLWKQTVQVKIANQATILDLMGFDGTPLRKMSEKVGSGDPENMEGRAASRYWDLILRKWDVTRGQDDGMPNAFFNYGYAILRAIVARSLVASGFLPALGIHHRNKYNAYCLADDIMEPFRPLVDWWIWQYLETIGVEDLPLTLRKEDKAHLLQIPVLDVQIEGKTGPLMVSMQRCTAGLMDCFEGTARKIPYPVL